MKKLINIEKVIPFLRKIQRDIIAKKKQSLFLFILCIFIAVYLGLSAGLLWFLFLSFALFGWDNRIIGGMALLCLIACPFLIQFKHEDIAERVAVYAFFFLVMMVTLQIIDFKRHPELYHDHEEKL